MPATDKIEAAAEVLQVQWSKGPIAGLPFVAEYLAVDGKFSKQCRHKGLLVKEPNYWDSDGLDFADTEVMWQLRATLYEWAEIASTLIFLRDPSRHLCQIP